MTNPETPNQEKQELIENAGREMAEVWMRKAVESAENDDQMNNQILALRSAAISILAHEAFNMKAQLDIEYKDTVHEITCDLAREIRLLDECDETIDVVSRKDKENG